jgi:D-sedoheptulose 7-phosphate isomerase
VALAADRRAVYDAALQAAAAAHERARGGDPAPLFAAVDAVLACVRAGGKLLTFGNGGSAADAQHLSAELVGRFVRERRAIGAIALSADTSIVTAVGNDYGFDRVFARQIEALGARGDVAVAISTSGGSANVLAGVETARDAGLTTIGLTGHDGGALGRAVDIHVNVPEQETARVQEVHRTLLHILCELVERELVGGW